MSRKRIGKIEAMYFKYGKNEGSKCKNCCNYAIYQFGKSRSAKCRAFGITSQVDSDWKGCYTGCGLYNTKFDVEKYSPIINSKMKRRDGNENNRC